MKDGGDVTLIDTLPQYEPEQLSHAPLSLVVTQIRFPTVLAIQTDEKALAHFQDLLRSRYPFLAVGQQIGISIGTPGIEQQQMSTKIYQFADTDRNWVVSLTADSVALEARQYTHYDDFSERIMGLIAAVKDVYSIEERQRLGLRYINEIRYPEVSHASDWSSLIRHELLGLMANSRIAALINSTLQEISLSLQNGGLTIRHGHFPQGSTVALSPGEDPKDEGPFYLLDFDAFDEHGRDLDARTLDGLLRSYNHTMFQLFRWLVHNQLYDYLKGGV